MDFKESRMMRKYLKYIILAVLSALLLLNGGCSEKDNVTSIPAATAAATETEMTNAASEDEMAAADAETSYETETEAVLDESGSYTSKEDVALYIYTYGKLPENFITKKEAKKLGWDGGSLEPYAPGMAIGGDRFGNYEGLLPEEDGVTYTECDIDTVGAKSRGAKQVFSPIREIFIIQKIIMKVLNSFTGRNSRERNLFRREISAANRGRAFILNANA